MDQKDNRQASVVADPAVDHEHWRRERRRYFTGSESPLLARHPKPYYGRVLRDLLADKCAGSMPLEDYHWVEVGKAAELIVFEVGVLRLGELYPDVRFVWEDRMYARESGVYAGTPDALGWAADGTLHSVVDVKTSFLVESTLRNKQTPWFTQIAWNGSVLTDAWRGLEYLVLHGYIGSTGYTADVLTPTPRRRANAIRNVERAREVAYMHRRGLYEYEEEAQSAE